MGGGGGERSALNRETVIVYIEWEYSLQGYS